MVLLLLLLLSKTSLFGFGSWIILVHVYGTGLGGGCQDQIGRSLEILIFFQRRIRFDILAVLLAFLFVLGLGWWWSDCGSRRLVHVVFGQTPSMTFLLLLSLLHGTNVSHCDNTCVCTSASLVAGGVCVVAPAREVGLTDPRNKDWSWLKGHLPLIVMNCV